MPSSRDLQLINSVIEACLDEAEQRGIVLTRATGRLFALVESGERDFEVLRLAALEAEKQPLAARSDAP